MNLYFCDLCNESIPQADMDLGRAVRRNERLICAACEAAMSPGGPRPVPPPVASVPPPRLEPAAPGSSIAAVALAFASVALVAGVAAGAYFFWRLEEDSRAVGAQLADLERTAPEHARTVSAALQDETAAREGEIATLRAAVQALGTRLQELEEADPAASALERRVEKLDERMATLDDLATRVEHQGRALSALETLVSSAPPVREPEPPPAETAPPATKVSETAPVPPAATAPGGTLWQKWTADLSSADSGTRWQAVQSLGGTRAPEAVPYIVPMLDDGDIFVRMASCRHLGDLGSVEAIPALIDTLEDEEASVREAALVALRTLSGQSIPFDPMAREGDRAKRVKAWREWWEQASKELAGPSRKKS